MPHTSKLNGYGAVEPLCLSLVPGSPLSPAKWVRDGRLNIIAWLLSFIAGGNRGLLYTEAVTAETGVEICSKPQVLATDFCCIQVIDLRQTFQGEVPTTLG